MPHLMASARVSDKTSAAPVATLPWTVVWPKRGTCCALGVGCEDGERSAARLLKCKLRQSTMRGRCRTGVGCAGHVPRAEGL
jgi:hypothetical protein